MRTGFPLLLLVLFSLYVRAQQPESARSFATGKLVDSLSQTPVGYATLTLYDTAGNHIAAGYSAENGVFRVPFQTHRARWLEISMVGYASRRIAIPWEAVPGVAPRLLSFDTIYLSMASDQLSAVSVSASRRLIDKRPGMLVYNAANDVTNKGGTAVDVLRKAPVMTVDAQGNVSMRGNSNIKILVNGKYSGQMARSLSDALNMMPADNIHSVEVITNPSAKYDAEGAAGVINIITRNAAGKMSGTVELSASNLEQMINPRLSLSDGKWNMTINGHLHRLQFRRDSDLHRVVEEDGAPTLSILQHTRKKNTAPHGSGDLAITYADSVSELSFGLNAWFGNWPDNRQLSGSTVNADGSVRDEYFQTVDTRANYLGSDINIGYSRRLNAAGREITLLAQFSPSKDDTWYYTLQTDKAGGVQYGERNDNKVRNGEWTLQADYVHPLSAAGKYIAETGLKMIDRNVGNRYVVEASTTERPGDYVQQPARSDHFQYRQQVWAGYGLIKLNMERGWYIEAGARAEHSLFQGDFETKETSFRNRFTHLIPTGTVSKKIDESHTVSLNYTRRLTRPYIWDLNPNIDESDPKNLVAGNPELRPEIADQAELSHGWSMSPGFFLNSSFFWKRTGGAIVDFARTDASGVSFTSKHNLGANEMYGVNLSASARLNERMQLNSSLNLDHLHYRSDALRILNKGWGAAINLNATRKLSRNFTIQGFGEYSTRVVTLQGSRGRHYYYSMAIKKDFPERGIMVTLAVVNPFARSVSQTTIMNAADFTSKIEDRYFTRAVKFTLNWEFGKNASQRQQRRISNEDIRTQGRG